MDFNARVVLDAPYPGDLASLSNLVDGLIDGLEMYGGRITATRSGRVALIFTVPAQTLQEAANTVLAVATAVGHPEPLALEIMPSEYPRGWSEEDPARAAAERAEALGSS